MKARHLFLATLLLVAPAYPVLAQGTEPLEQLVIEMATTPEHHRALAEYFRGKANSTRGEAERHRSMADAYRKGKFRSREMMRDHCDGIVSRQEAVAKEYEELAALHEQEAKAQP